MTLFVDTMSGTKEVRIDVLADLGDRELYCQATGSARATPSTDATLRPAAECVEQLVAYLHVHMRQAAEPAAAASAPAS